MKESKMVRTTVEERLEALESFQSQQEAIQARQDRAHKIVREWLKTPAPLEEFDW